MTTILQTESKDQKPTLRQNQAQTITGEDLISVLSSAQLMPQIIREIVIEKAIADIPYTQEEFKLFYQNFLRINTNQKHPESIVLRQFKIHKFKHLNFGNQVENYFLSKKHLLDQVSFSLIQTNSAELAQEIYFRIQEGEESFTELAKKYSQGPEAKNGGWAGTFKFANLNPQLGAIIHKLQPGQIPQLIVMDKVFIIVRLEQFLPAQLTPQLREELLQEMFEDWIKSQMDSYQDSLDLSTITQSDLLMEDQNQNTETIFPGAEALPEIDNYESSEIVDQYINNYQKWKNTKLVTASFLCLVSGGLVGFYLSDLSHLSHAALTVGASETNDAFHDAVNHATKAANLTQSAKTPSQWQRVSQSWINAIALLNSLPENHPQYTLANEKIKEYERNLNYSRKNSENSHNDFRIAVNHATNAANLTQTASSSKEWETVIEHWQSAITLMKTVKPNSPNYFVAQQKTIEYQRNLNYAFSVIKQQYPDSHLISEAI